MCLLQQVFYEGRAFSEPHMRTVVFALSSRCKTELLQLCIFGPFLFSNLRAEPIESLFATDASPFAAGGCRARISREFSYELFRTGTSKGHRTGLQGPLKTYFREVSATLDRHSSEHISQTDLEALENLVEDQDDICVEVGVPYSRSEGVIFAVVEVFSGGGIWSSAHSE